MWPKRVRIPSLLTPISVSYLHGRNIIFRDLKSKNILVSISSQLTLSLQVDKSSEWKAKVCDFGFARDILGQHMRPMTVCGTGTLRKECANMHSDEWMAPEVILGMDYNQRADVFSYGIVLV